MKTTREMIVWTASTHGPQLAIVALFVTGAVAQTLIWKTREPILP
jgi:hypothetical protein